MLSDWTCLNLLFGKVSLLKDKIVDLSKLKANADKTYTCMTQKLKIAFGRTENTAQNADVFSCSQNVVKACIPQVLFCVVIGCISRLIECLHLH